MRRRWLLAVASLALSVAIAEAGLRGLDRFRPPAPIPQLPEFYRPDPELGYTLWPSKQTTYRYPRTSPRLISLVSNADGFRSSREFDEPDPRQRVWMLGDSFVFGHGVEAADRLTEVIERLEPRWRVENMGMTGWGLDLMVRTFERISQRVKPHLVVVAFYPIAVVFLPGRSDTFEDQTRRHFLAQWCREASVPFLDLTDVIHEVGDPAFIRGNPHWNERGHQLAGTAIHAFLRDSRLVD